jgi:hypothetical protein
MSSGDSGRTRTKETDELDGLAFQTTKGTAFSRSPRWVSFSANRRLHRLPADTPALEHGADITDALRLTIKADLQVMRGLCVLHSYHITLARRHGSTDRAVNRTNLAVFR